MYFGIVVNDRSRRMDRLKRVKCRNDTVPQFFLDLKERFEIIKLEKT